MIEVKARGIDVTDEPNLPSRPETHVLETAGIRAFEQRIPPDWTSTTPVADYGIDRDVEVFREGHTTGLKFGVQLKASKQDLTNALGVQIKVSTYRYLLGNPYPCMLVMYHEPSESLYWRWIGRFRVEPSESAKTVTLRLTDHDTWEDETAGKITGDLMSIRDWFFSDPPTPLSYQVRLSGDVSEITRSELVARLNAGSEGSLLRAEQTAGRWIEVEFAADYVEARLDSDVASLRWSHNGNVGLGVIADSGVVVVCVALLVAQTGKLSVAATLLSGASMEAIQMLGGPTAWQVGIILVAASSVDSVVSLLESEYALETSEACAILGMLLGGVRLAAGEQLFLDERATERLADGVVSALRRVNADLDRTWAGMEWERTADLYFHALQYRQALLCLRMAARANRELKSNGHWLRKCGAVTFELGRFVRSASLYRAAIDCSENTGDLLGPLADALMLSGEYAEALRTFDSYLETTQDPEPWWFLKAIGLGDLRSTEFWREAGREDVPSSLIDRIQNDDSDAGSAAASEALLLDLTCHEAWDRYAYEMVRRGEWERALTAYIMASVTNPKCLNGYVGAIQMAIKSAVPPLLSLIVALGSYANGEAFVADLLADIREQTGDVPHVLEQSLNELADVGLDWRRRKTVVGVPRPA